MLIRPSNAVIALVVVLVGALLAIMVPYGPEGRAAHAQTAPATVSYAENGTGPVATLAATDQDGDAIEWSLAGDDAADFDISDAGVLTFKESPNYESPADNNKDNVYLVSVNASETSDPLSLEITVTDVDEAGKVSLTQPQPQIWQRPCGQS